MNRINEIDNTIEGKETKTYYQDHSKLVVLSGRLYGKVTYVEYFDAYYLQFGDNVYYFPQKDSYQEGRNWKKKKFDSYEECLNFSQQHNIKIVMKSTVKSPFSNGLHDPRFLFPKRNTPYSPYERTDVSRIRENKHNINMNKKLIRLTEQDLHKIVKESIKKLLKESVGVFEVYTNDYMQNAPVFVKVGEEFYKVPQEMEFMIGELGTRQGRMTFIDAITNGEIPSCNVDVLKLKGHGYKSRAFNANAF